MELSLKKQDLKLYLKNQLEYHFPDGLTSRYYEGEDVDSAFEEALYKLENCFRYVTLPAYSNEGGADLFFSFAF